MDNDDADDDATAAGDASAAAVRERHPHLGAATILSRSGCDTLMMW